MVQMHLWFVFVGGVWCRVTPAIFPHHQDPFSEANWVITFVYIYNYSDYLIFFF